MVDAAGYGIKFREADRDRHFDIDWNEVVLELDGMEPALIPLSSSFWRGCSELRSAEIGRWLLDQHAAPWRSGEPPGIVVHHLADNRFKARLLKRRDVRARS